MAKGTLNWKLSASYLERGCMPSSRWIEILPLGHLPKLQLLCCGEAERDCAIAGTEGEGGLRSAGRGASIRRGEGSQLARRQSREPWQAKSPTDAAQPATWDGTTPSRHFLSTALRGIGVSLHARGLGFEKRHPWNAASRLHLAGTPWPQPPHELLVPTHEQLPQRLPQGLGFSREAESEAGGCDGELFTRSEVAERSLTHSPTRSFPQRVLHMLHAAFSLSSRSQSHAALVVHVGVRAQADDGWNSEEDVRASKPKPQPHGTKSDRGAAAAKSQQATTDSAVDAVTAQLAATSMRSSASAATPRTATAAVAAKPPVAVASVAAAAPAVDAAALDPQVEPYVPQDPKLELERKARSLRKKVL